MAPTEDAARIIAEVSAKNIDDCVRVASFTHELEEVCLDCTCKDEKKLANGVRAVHQRPHPRGIDQLALLPQAGS